MTRYNIYSLDTPLTEALAHYQRKHGAVPNVVRVHPGNDLEADGVRVVRDESVLTKEYWVGREDE